MGKWRLKEFDQSAQAHTSNQWSWNLNLGGVTPEPALWSTAQIIPISSPKLCLPPLSADRKQKPPSRDRAHQISQTFHVDTGLLSSPTEEPGKMQNAFLFVDTLRLLGLSIARWVCSSLLEQPDGEKQQNCRGVGGRR